MTRKTLVPQIAVFFTYQVQTLIVCRLLTKTEQVKRCEDELCKLQQEHECTQNIFQFENMTLLEEKKYYASGTWNCDENTQNDLPSMFR